MGGPASGVFSHQINDLQNILNAVYNKCASSVLGFRDISNYLKEKPLLKKILLLTCSCSIYAAARSTLMKMKLKNKIKTKKSRGFQERILGNTQIELQKAIEHRW